MKLSTRINDVLTKVFGVTENGDQNVRFSWHSLNEDFYGNPFLKNFPFPIQGRSYLRIRPNQPSSELYFSWNLWTTNMLHLYVRMDNDAEHAYMFSVAFPPAAFWFGVNPKWKSKWRPKKERAYSLTWFEGGLQWNFGTSSWGWNSKNPGWRTGIWEPAETIFGNSTHKTKEVETRRISVPMPEGDYPGTARLLHIIRGRKRNPFKHHFYAVDIKMDEGWTIPFPGKGENSWDCEDSGISGHYGPHESIRDAVAHMMMNVLNTRQERGSKARWPVYPPPPQPPPTPDSNPPTEVAGACG